MGHNLWGYVLYRKNKKHAAMSSIPFCIVYVNGLGDGVETLAWT